MRKIWKVIVLKCAVVLTLFGRQKPLDSKIYCGKLATVEREVRLAKNLWLKLDMCSSEKAETFVLTIFTPAVSLHFPYTQSNKENIKKNIFEARQKRGELIISKDKNGVVVLK